MPKTTPVPEADKQSIRRIKELHPEKSGRQIAELVGYHQKTVNEILNEKPSTAAKGPETPVLAETSVVKGDEWTITLPKTRIHTPEELVEQFQIDLSLWEVERWVANKWEMGYKDKDDKAKVEPLYQVKAFLKKRKEVEDARKEVAELKKLAVDFPAPPPIRTIVPPDDLLLELTLPDVHFGKLSWGLETGHANYDVKIAESVYWTALEAVINRVDHLRFSKVLFVVGNDILNSDDIEGRTTAGTYVSSDARYHKTFASVRNIIIRATERLREIAPTEVMTVSGNHDQLSCWHLGDSLECYFHNYQDVEVENSPRQRKYYEHGLVGLMFTHGHKAKRTDYPALMAAEQPKMWGRTKFRECHTGHLHMTKTDEQHGFRTRILPSALTPSQTNTGREPTRTRSGDSAKPMLGTS